MFQNSRDALLAVDLELRQALQAIDGDSALNHKIIDFNIEGNGDDDNNISNNNNNNKASNRYTELQFKEYR